ncbi:MAG: hypothetical protein V1827_02170 [Candidatus Micrarchaeota archaeon]
MKAYAQYSLRELVRRDLAALDGRRFSLEQCPGILSQIENHSPKPGQRQFHEMMIGGKTMMGTLEQKVENIARYIEDLAHDDGVGINRPFSRCSSILEGPEKPRKD